MGLLACLGGCGDGPSSTGGGADTESTGSSGGSDGVQTGTTGEPTSGGTSASGDTGDPEDPGDSEDTGDSGGTGETGGDSPGPGQADQRVFYMGHSLINRRIPAMVDGLAGQHPDVTHAYGLQILNGSKLADQWADYDNPAKVPDGGFQRALQDAKFDAMVLTERVPIVDHRIYWGTDCHAGLIYQFCHGTNPDITLYLHVAWTSFKDPDGSLWDKDRDTLPPLWGQWRDMIDSEYAQWREIAENLEAGSWPAWDSVRDPYEDCPAGTGFSGWRHVEFIPAGLALAQLYDELKAGPIASISTMEDVFKDDIHLNDTGWYLIASTIFAKLYGRDPAGLGTEFRNGDLVDYNPPDAETARELQRIAWDTVNRTAGD